MIDIYNTLCDKCKAIKPAAVFRGYYRDGVEYCLCLNCITTYFTNFDTPVDIDYWQGE